jgi:hypothetical protein
MPAIIKSRDRTVFLKYKINISELFFNSCRR